MSKEVDQVLEDYEREPKQFKESDAVLITELKILKEVEVKLVNEMEKLQELFLNNLTTLKGEFTKNKGALEVIQKLLMKNKK